MPLCLGEGKLKRTEILERLGVGDFARVAQLSIPDDDLDVGDVGAHAEADAYLAVDERHGRVWNEPQPRTMAFLLWSPERS